MPFIALQRRERFDVGPNQSTDNVKYLHFAAPPIEPSSTYYPHHPTVKLLNSDNSRLHFRGVVTTSGRECRCASTYGTFEPGRSGSPTMTVTASRSAQLYETTLRPAGRVHAFDDVALVVTCSTTATPSPSRVASGGVSLHWLVAEKSLEGGHIPYGSPAVTAATDATHMPPAQRQQVIR